MLDLMKKIISPALERSISRIEMGYPIEREADFQSVLFGELYKELPTAIIRLEKRMSRNYQSYSKNGRKSGIGSLVDIHLQVDERVVVIELKYFKGASKENCLDMLADIAKIERIIEAGEADEGFCLQLANPDVAKKLPTGLIERRRYKDTTSGWNYDFEIRGQYTIAPTIPTEGNHAIILHHITSC